jgi:HEAT repeat protein
MRDGVLVARIPVAEASVERMRRWMEGVLFCAQHLAIPDEALGGGLARLALSDPGPAVRVHALRALVLEGDPAAEQVVRAVHSSADPQLQVLCAWQRGAHHDLVTALARSDLPADTRSDAALGLVRADRAVVTRALEGLWAVRPDVTWAWALRVFRHNRVTAAVPGALSLLQRRVGRAPRAVREARLEALRLVGELGEGAAIEPVLIELVRTDDALRLPAIRMLGQMGTPRAVEALLEWSSGLPFSEVRSAAASAVEQIQARVGDAERGGLSIAAVEGGGLALVDPRDAEGGLSVEDTSGA